MRARKAEDRRQSRRRAFNRIAKLQVASGTLPRDCLITNISDGGVRLHVEGFDVPDEFTLLLSGEGMGQTERRYRVVWRLGFEVGAEFLGVIKRGGLASRG